MHIAQRLLIYTEKVPLVRLKLNFSSKICLLSQLQRRMLPFKCLHSLASANVGLVSSRWSQSCLSSVEFTCVNHWIVLHKYIQLQRVFRNFIEWAACITRESKEQLDFILSSKYSAFTIHIRYVFWINFGERFRNERQQCASCFLG